MMNPLTDVMNHPTANRGWSIRGLIIGFCCLALVVTMVSCSSDEVEPIKAGILHSQTGALAASESPVADATLMAIDEINEAGGLLDRQIEPVIVDARSDSTFAAEEAQRLIVEEKVAAIFGCWTSACRKNVKEVVEEHDSLLIYPVQFEGLEQSPNIIYTGSTPNQQIIPAIDWAHAYLGQRFFLAGSDYIFPRAANEIIKEKIDRLGGEIVGEEYILLGSSDVNAAVQNIVDLQPDVILNTINGDTNVAFFRALSDAGISADDMPVVSFSIGEAEIQEMDISDIAGHYAAWNYFQSVETSVNKRFLENYQSRYGADRVTSDPIEAGYNGVHLWARAVEEGGSVERAPVVVAVADQTLSTPQGFVRVDPENQHLWKSVRIGQVRSDGQFDIVWDPGTIISPRPFPKSRPQDEWEQFLEDLYFMWNGSWENPG